MALKSRRVVVVGMVFGVCLTLGLTSSMASGLYSGNAPTTPLPATGGPTPTPIPPPEGARASFLRNGPTLVSTVLHWSTSDFFANSTSPDPSNGQQVLGDIWMEMGTSGEPVRARTLVTFVNGTFHQEAVLSSQTRTMVVSPRTAPSAPNTTPVACIREGVVSGLDMMLNLGPIYIDENVLQSQGYILTGPLVIAFPMTVGLAGGPPQASLGTENGRLFTKTEQFADGQRKLSEVGVGDNGRALYFHGLTLDASGNRLAESRTSIGRIDAYDPSVISASMFDLSQYAREICNASA